MDEEVPERHTHWLGHGLQAKGGCGRRRQVEGMQDPPPRAKAEDTP